jgi:hypothetical protein
MRLAVIEAFSPAPIRTRPPAKLASLVYNTSAAVWQLDLRLIYTSLTDLTHWYGTGEKWYHPSHYKF